MGSQGSRSMTDWLDGPVDEADAWLGPAEALPAEAPVPAEELQLVPRGVSPVAIPANADERNATLQAAWDRLSRRQQIFLHQLRASHFNTSDACRVLAKSGSGDAVHRTTANRWAERD